MAFSQFDNDWITYVDNRSKYKGIYPDHVGERWRVEVRASPKPGEKRGRVFRDHTPLLSETNKIRRELQSKRDSINQKSV